LFSGFCLPGTFSCGDGENCYSHSQKCDSEKDCIVTVADEKGCGKSIVNEICQSVQQFNATTKVNRPESGSASLDRVNMLV